MIDLDLLYRVAIDYYKNKKLQREIAEELNVSRVQVSKYLTKAEQVGIVKIDVVRPQVQSAMLLDIKSQLLEKFPLQDVLLSPSYGNVKSLQDTLFSLAEEYMFSCFSRSPITVGIGWGSTTYSFVSTDFSEVRPEWKILPLTGGSTFISSKYFNINHIAHVFAEKLGASLIPIYLPLMIQQEDWSYMNRSEDFRRIEELWDGLDLIVCSIGRSIPRSPLFREGIIGEEFIEQLEKKSVIGDMLTHYFDIEGNIIDLGVERQIINVSTNQIRRAKKKLVLAYGKEKSRCILGGLRTGLIDILAIDADTAMSVLALSEE